MSTDVKVSAHALRRRYGALFR